MGEFRQGRELIERYELCTYGSRIVLLAALVWRRLRGWEVTERGEPHPGTFVVHFRKYEDRE